MVERDFLNLVRILQREEGLTVLLVTHTLQIPLNFCDEVLLFNNGRVNSCRADDLVQTNKLESIYGVPFIQDQKKGVRWVIPEGMIK